MKPKHSLLICGLGVVGLLLIPITWWLSWQINGLIGHHQILPPATLDWLKCLPHAWLAQSRLGSEYWPGCHRISIEHGFFRGLVFSANSFAVSLLIFIVGVGSLFFVEQPRTQIIDGLRLYRGEAAIKQLKRVFRAKIKQTGDRPGFEFLGKVKWPLKQELRHWMVLGAMGSGKTVFIRMLIALFAARGDKIIVLDVQGDFVSTLYWCDKEGRKRRPVILSPFDARSAEWHLGSDFRTVPDFRELGAHFAKKDGRDDFWVKASISLLISVCQSLVADYGANWSWRDLSQRIYASNDQLLAWAREHYPPAVQALEAEGSQTSASILINFATDFALIHDIAAFWRGGKDAKRISISGFLRIDAPNRRLMVLGWDASRQEQSLAWTGAFIDLLGRTIASPKYKAGHRLNLILDEFSSFKIPMEGVVSAIERGRAKNVSTLIGLQSPAQLRDVYQERAAGFSSIVGNHVFAQTAPGQDAEEASKFLGMQTIRQLEVSYSKSQNQTSKSEHWIEKKVPVFSPSQFSQELGPRKGGVRVLFTGIELDAYLLDIPFTDAQPLRQQFVEAKPQQTIPARKEAQTKSASKPKRRRLANLVKSDG